MAIEETIENKAQEALLAGARIGVRTSWAIARFLLACGWTITKGGTKLTAEQISQHLNSGLMSERRLQRKGEDVHTMTVPSDALKALGPSMKRAGLDYSMDINDDNTVTIYFMGRDSDHISHALDRALKETGLDTTQLEAGEPDQPAPTQTMEADATRSHPATETDEPSTPRTTRETHGQSTPATARATPEHDTVIQQAPTTAAGREGRPPRQQTRKDLINAFKTEADRRIAARRQQHGAPKQTLETKRSNSRASR